MTRDVLLAAVLALFGNVQAPLPKAQDSGAARSRAGAEYRRVPAAAQAVRRSEASVSSAHDRAVPVVGEPGRGHSPRAVAPSLPDWRLALDAAAVVGFVLGLAALVLLMVMYERA